MSESTISCLRCRGLKTKCSRENPSCTRCTRFHSICIYPPSPDRKKIARLRDSRSRQKAIMEYRSTFTSTDVDRASSPNSSNTSQNESSEAINRHQVQYSDLQPSWDLALPFDSTGLALIDLYFTNILNSHCLIDKEILVHRFMNRLLPSFTVQSIFASSLRFLKPEPCLTERQHEVQSEALNSRGLADTMALDSSAAIHAQAELNPTDAFPATYNLILYWFSTGAANQVNAHLEIASRCGRALTQKYTRHPHQRDVELTKRCRLAWRFYHLLNDNTQGAISVLDSQNLEVDEGNICSRWDQKSEGIWNHVLESVTLWAKTRKFVSSAQASSDAQAMWNDLCGIDSQLEIMIRKLSPVAVGIRPSTDEAFNHFQCEILIRSLYHVSKVTLFSSAYSSMKRLEHLSPDNCASRQNACTKKLCTHILSFSDTIWKILMSRADDASITPFAGYSAFVTASVSLHCLLGQERPKSELIIKHIQMVAMPCLVVLYRLQHYWFSIKEMWHRLKPLLSPAGIALSDISDWHGTQNSAFHAKSEDCSSSASGIISSNIALAAFVQLVDGVIGKVDLSDPRYLKLPCL